MDVWTLRLVVLTLGVALVGLVGALAWCVVMGCDIPASVAALAGTIAGFLGGLLVPPGRGG